MLGKEFLDLTSKVQSLKGKTGKMNFIKILNFALWKTLLRR